MPDSEPAPRNNQTVDLTHDFLKSHRRAYSRGGQENHAHCALVRFVQTLEEFGKRHDGTKQTNPDAGARGVRCHRRVRRTKLTSGDGDNDLKYLLPKIHIH